MPNPGVCAAKSNPGGGHWSDPWAPLRLPRAEAGQISQALQVDFDTMLRNILLKYHPFPGLALLLGGLLRYRNAGGYTSLPEITASLYLGRQRGEGYIFNDIGLFGLLNVMFNRWSLKQTVGTPQFLSYLAEFLENPERSDAHVFDQQKYATASKECFQLCLCNNHNFSKGTVESADRDNALRRSRPSVWMRRLGVHSRIRKAKHYLKVRQRKSLKPQIVINQHGSYPDKSPEHQFCWSLSYRWSLDLLPFFLKKSAISLELAEVLHRCIFTTMAQKFPRRRTLAKEAIAKYLLQVESAVPEPWIVGCTEAVSARMRICIFLNSILLSSTYVLLTLIS